MHDPGQSRLENIPSGIMSTLNSIQQSLLDQGAEIKAIKEQMQDHVGRILLLKMTSAVQSSITDATNKWKDQWDISHAQHTSEIIAHFEIFAKSLDAFCSDLGHKHSHKVSTLSGLVEQYDQTANDTNDHAKAYGNELAMMRLNLEACADRLNWLVEDLGLKSETKTLPKVMEGVMEEAYKDYF